ncbi:ATP-binding protein [Micromonospora sp. bgisy143]|uniref:ATP-binding protein n=1 Tax=Micromonospora sp. bgisy143 TaxID=3413790 RepID=UPI003EBF7EBE
MLADDHSGGPRYEVAASEGQGVVIGEGHTVHQYFGAAPPFRPTAMHQLPPDTGHFVGRQPEIDRVLTAVESEWTGNLIFTVSGIAGMGKSAFAIHVANRLTPSFPDAQLYLDLNAYGPSYTASENHALESCLRALGVAPEVIPASRSDQLKLYRSLLAGKRVLLLIENVAAAAQVTSLLPNSGRCLVLVTSRTRLPELAVSNSAHLMMLDALSVAESIDLLANICGATRVAAERKEAERLAAACGYLPLALRIAAVRLVVRPNLAIADLLHRLLVEGSRLNELAVGDVEVRAGFNLSYQTLGHEVRHIFRLLSLCVGPDFSLPAAAALLDISSQRTEQTVEGLVDVHLVDIVPGTERRYRMHDLIREFCWERCTDEEPEESQRAARQRLLEWYLAMATSAEERLIPTRIRPWRAATRGGVVPDLTRASALDWFEAERVNLLAACEDALRSGSYDLCWQIADASWGFYQLRKYWTDWEESHSFGLDAARLAGNRQGEAWMLTGLGGVLWERHDLDRAVESLNLALDLHRLAADQSGEARTLINLGFAYLHATRYEMSASSAREALRIARELDDDYRKGWALYCLSKSEAHLGNRQEAITSCRAALEIWRATGNRMAEGFTLDSLGELYRDSNDAEQSYRYFLEALAIRREVNDVYGEGGTLYNLGHLASLRLGPRHAVPYWTTSLAIFERLGAPEAAMVRAELRALPDEVRPDRE